jgi:hypothetical protein
MFIRAFVDAIEPGLKLADADRMFGLRLFDADGQAGCRAKEHFCESAPVKLAERQHGRFVDRRCGPLDRVFEAFGIGERDPAGAGGHGLSRDSVPRWTVKRFLR